MNANACSGNHIEYVRHQPEKTLLYQVVANNLETWLAQRRMEGGENSLPDFVEKELRAFLDCGLLERGFILITCEKCKNMIPVAHSCKKRGFCPSCGAKRMSETTYHLIENVLPHVPYRQFVVTFPYPLRYWMATNRSLTNKVHKLVTSLIMSYYRAVAAERGIDGAEPGGVTFIQRFGSAANLHPHFHIIVADGVWSKNTGKPQFYEVAGPSTEDVCDIVQEIASQTIAMLRKENLLSEKGEMIDRPDALDDIFSESEQLLAATAASLRMRIAFGSEVGSKVRRIGSGFGYEEEIGLVKGKRLASANNFTVHANRFIGAQERKKLRELISYTSRPAFSHQRLSLKDPDNPDGDLVYSLKTPWGDGTEAIVIDQMQMIEKLVALIPPPYLHLTRQFGAFGPHSGLRRDIILKPHVKKGFVAAGEDKDPVRMSWALLLAVTFKADVERCKVCGARVYPDKFDIFDQPEDIQKVMLVMGLKYQPPPIRPARGVTPEYEFDQRCPEE